MKLLFLLASLIVTVKGVYINHPIKLQPSSSNRIVGGDNADISDHPWQLSFQLDDYGHFCGAAIISDQWGVTAAYCVILYDVIDLTVRAGSSYHRTGGQKYQVLEYIVHPDRTPFSDDLDVAVFRIEGTFSGENMTPIRIADIEPEAGSNVVITGWGFPNASYDFLHDELQAVSVPIVSRTDCNVVYGGYVTENMFCSGEAGRGTCSGDMGNPLVNSDGELVGVVALSWGVSCASGNFPDVNTNLVATTIREFIREYAGV